MLGLRFSRSFGPLTSARQLARTSRPWNIRQIATEAEADAPPRPDPIRKLASSASYSSCSRAISIGPEPIVKRFWKNVGVDKRGDSVAVTLDNRTLKTPNGNPILLPKSKAMLATLIAHEWEVQERLVKHHALPMV